MAKRSLENRIHTSRKHECLIRLSEPIRESLSKTQYTPPESTNVSVKSILQDLLPSSSSKNSELEEEEEEEEIRRSEIRDFCLCCAALAAAASSSSSSSSVEGESVVSWIPRELSVAAEAALGELSNVICGCCCCCCDLDGKEELLRKNVDFDSVSDERKLVVELMPEVLPLLKRTIKESSIDDDDNTDDGDEISAACARAPVAYAVVAAYQFRWLVTQVDYPHLGKLCSLVIPCALTALDHWSPDVKSQAMISFIHIAKNVNATELCWYEDVILDICCRNIASTDELWHHVVEMSVLMVTCIQRKNPRSSWYERMMTEMLSHLERHPRNKDRRTAWLELIEPFFNGMGLVLLAHFRRIFPLLFQWMHADDDRTVLLVLERVHTILKLTWIRNTPYIERLVDELTITYKEAALRRGREDIRKHTLQILVLLQKCKGLQFESAWDKHKDDPNLVTLSPSLCKNYMAKVVDEMDHARSEVL